MSKSKPFKLFSLKALAHEEDITHNHMLRLMMDIAKQDVMEWRGWSFLPVGSGPRKSWLAYKGKPGDVVIINEPEEPNQKADA